MNKDNAAQFLPLVQALADGKTIQYNDAGTWFDMAGESVAFGNEISHYRIKPEPQEVTVWITKFSDGSICGLTTSDMSVHADWIKTTATVQVP